jgi:hypothetical protein
VSLYATEVVLEPRAIHCAVVNESFTARRLVVKPAATSNGYDNLAWREAYRALLRDEQSGWRADSLSFYGRFAGEELLAFAEPDPDRAALRFRFQDGDPAYERLTRTRGLFAIATVNLHSYRFLAVTFKHRP